MKKFNLLLNFKFSVILSCLALVILMSSCGDDEGDPCEGITVPAGFTCVNGVLTQNDLCVNVTCPAGTECQDGTCVVTDACQLVTCPAGYTCNGGVCILDGHPTAIKSGKITGMETWSKDTIYVLINKVVVDSLATLTIEAGTIIKGAEGAGSLASALVVARGGTLIADGTAAMPIIMTTILDEITPGDISSPNLDETTVGQWGGLIVLGRAPISVTPAGEAQIEGIPADESYGTYGAKVGEEVADDNSGIIRYVSVRHGGALIGANNEINGITFGGVGSGTTVDHIEVVANLDDGVEFFGGTVNASNVVVWAQGDDAYDIDQAYSGTISNFVYIAGPDSDHGMEIDGPEGTLDGQCKLMAGTMKGMSAEYADFRKAAQANVSNVLWFNFSASADFELDDAGSSANYHNAASPKLILTGMEFVTTATAADIFEDTGDATANAAFETKMAADNAIVGAVTGNVGADTSVFGWTMAKLSGALDF